MRPQASQIPVASDRGEGISTGIRTWNPATLQDARQRGGGCVSVALVLDAAQAQSIRLARRFAARRPTVGASGDSRGHEGGTANPAFSTWGL